jgi:DNA gyrase/topoisomerase IV subunit B
VCECTFQRNDYYCLQRRKRLSADIFKGKAQTGVEEIGHSDKRGTKQFFQPDDTIFTELVYNYDTLASRLRELSYLNKGITITLTDEREKLEDGSFRSEVFHSEGGLKSLLLISTETVNLLWNT